MGTKVVKVNENDLEWMSAVGLMAGLTDEEQEYYEGVMMRPLFEDDESGRFITRVWIKAGYREPKHKHNLGHGIFVLKGAIYDADTGETLVSEGTYWYAPAGDVHGPFTFTADYQAIFMADGPIDTTIIYD